MFQMLNGAKPPGILGSVKAPAARVTGLNCASNTSMPPDLKFAAKRWTVGVVTIARPLYTAFAELSIMTNACVASAPFAHAESTPSSVTKMKPAATAALPGAVTGNVGGVVAGAVLATIPVQTPLGMPAPGTVGWVVGLGVPSGVAFVAFTV